MGHCAGDCWRPHPDRCYRRRHLARRQQQNTIKTAQATTCSSGGERWCFGRQILPYLRSTDPAGRQVLPRVWHTGEVIRLNRTGRRAPLRELATRDQRKEKRAGWFPTSSFALLLRRWQKSQRSISAQSFPATEQLCSCNNYPSPSK